MPISKYRYGVLVVLIAILELGILIWPGNIAFAHETTLNSTHASQPSTTKGVSEKTVSSKRRPSPVGTTATKPANTLPKEVKSDGSKQNVIDRAKQMIGSRYRYGGASPKTGFDCSGYIRYVYGDQASKLPRSSSAMYRAVNKTSELSPGDLVFFRRGRAVGHVGLYIGEGQVAHASTPRSGVRVDSLNALATNLGYVGAGRI